MDSAPTASSHEIKLNRLLAALPDAELERWLPQLELVDMPVGQVLYEAGKVQPSGYFPTSALVSLLYVLENGDSAEIALVGNEGIVGISVFLGGNSTISRAVVQSGGKGFRLKAKLLKDEFDLRGAVTHLLMRYTQALMAQISQSSGCSKHHFLDKQLCRRLLLCLDHLPGNELVMTHQLLANMLGVRRVSVTNVALNIQKAGLISYARGRIQVLDRVGLQNRCCRCYSVVKGEYDRLFPVGIDSLDRDTCTDPQVLVSKVLVAIPAGNTGGTSFQKINTLGSIGTLPPMQPIQPVVGGVPAVNQ